MGSAGQNESKKPKARSNLDFKNDLQKIKDVVSNLEQPEMNPHIFEQMCKTAGAENFYLSIKNAMWSERMSEEAKIFHELDVHHV